MINKETIKKSYGEFWYYVKDYVDQNGWCRLNVSQISPINTFSHYGQSEWTIINDIRCWRPKTLNKIQTNN